MGSSVGYDSQALIFGGSLSVPLGDVQEIQTTLYSLGSKKGFAHSFIPSFFEKFNSYSVPVRKALQTSAVRLYFS